MKLCSVCDQAFPLYRFARYSAWCRECDRDVSAQLAGKFVEDADPNEREHVHDPYPLGIKLHGCRGCAQTADFRLPHGAPGSCFR